MSSRDVQSPFDNAKPADYKEKFMNRRSVTEYADPCELAAKASMDCLDRHSYDRNKCMDYFQAYKDCKKAWIAQRKEDVKAGKRIY